jgi:hypothetical protein
VKKQTKLDIEMIDNLISSENMQSKETKLAWLQASQKALGGQEGMQNWNDTYYMEYQEECRHGR